MQFEYITWFFLLKLGPELSKMQFYKKIVTFENVKIKIDFSWKNNGKNSIIFVIACTKISVFRLWSEAARVQRNILTKNSKVSFKKLSSMAINNLVGLKVERYWI